MKLIDKLKNQGLDIPHLCSNNILSPYTSCWLCIAEIDGEKRPLPSCWYEYREGLNYQVQSEELENLRREILSLYISNHFADCLAPCKNACPAHIDIQGYLRFIKDREFRSAFELIRDRCPLPRVIGRVCPRFCEKDCYRNLIDEPLRINDAKKFVADLISPKYLPQQVPLRTPLIKVAVIGSGPAGLTVSYYLRRKGIKVDVFEKESKPGGMLYYAIPDFRLPKDVVLDEADLIFKEGIDVYYNQEWGKDFSIDDLLKKGYKAVFVTIGAPKSKKFFEQGIGSLEFLKEYNSGKIKELKGKVVVMGGGNTAMDCALTSRRLGADVIVVYRRTREEMPAFEEEIEETLKGGVKIRFLVNPKEVKEKSIVLQKMTLGEPDSSGRRKPVPVDEFEEIKCDYFIQAIGQSFYFPEELGNRENIFIAGDALTGPKTVIEAIASARERVEEFLAKLENRVYKKTEFISKKNYWSLKKEDFNVKEEKRKQNLIDEVNRCMECGCKEIENCKLKYYATQLKIEKPLFIGEVQKTKNDFKDKRIVYSREKCILCGECVRVAQEVVGCNALSLVGRGFSTRVAPALDNSLKETNCFYCGMCVDICPTGALKERKYTGPFLTKKFETKCNLCGALCDVIIEKRGEKIERVIGNPYICYYGKFYYPEKEKILYPMFKGENIDEFFEYMRREKIYILLSPRISYEEYEVFKKLKNVFLRRISSKFIQKEIRMYF